MDRKLNARAQRIVTNAQDQARALNHDFVGTEHLLLGLLDEGEGIAVKTLEAIEVDPLALRDAVSKAVVPGRRVPSSPVPLTHQGVRVLNVAAVEAGRLGQDQVGTEHILLALISESEGVAARVLKSKGATIDKARRKVIEFRNGRQGAPPPPAHYPPGSGSQTFSAVVASGTSTIALVERFGQNLTADAREGRLYPSVGREEEISKIIGRLSLAGGSTPLLAGTRSATSTVINGLAQRIASGEVPAQLANAQLYRCDSESMAAAVAEVVRDSALRGRVTALISAAAPPSSRPGAQQPAIGPREVLAATLLETRARADMIVIVDDLPSVADDPLCKPLLSGGARRIIGTATLEACRERTGTDATFAQRTWPVLVPEATTAYDVSKLRMAVRTALQATPESRPS